MLQVLLHLWVSLVLLSHTPETGLADGHTGLAAGDTGDKGLGKGRGRKGDQMNEIYDSIETMTNQCNMHASVRGSRDQMSRSLLFQMVTGPLYHGTIPDDRVKHGQLQDGRGGRRGGGPRQPAAGDAQGGGEGRERNTSTLVHKYTSTLVH